MSQYGTHAREEIAPYKRDNQVLSAPSLYALSTRVLNYLPLVSTSPRGEREFPDALSLLIEDGGRVGGQLVENRISMGASEWARGVRSAQTSTWRPAADWARGPLCAGPLSWAGDA